MKITIELNFGTTPVKEGVDLDDLKEHIQELAKNTFREVDMPRYDYLYPKIKVERD
jgi:hypothetical protein